MGFMPTGGPSGLVEHYEPFFGLNEAPFSLVPDPRFLFASASHSTALAQVAYALERREPLVVITGEVGTGKTLLCRTVLQRLERKTFLSVIDDPLLERDDLLKQLLRDFGVVSTSGAPAGVGRHDLVQALRAFLSSLSPIDAHAVVIVDEAQHLQPDVLEQIRLLANADDGRGGLLQIILAGQEGLEQLLSRPDLRQLQQRVSRRLVLKPLDGEEVRQYIEHRLEQARGRGEPPSRLPGARELAEELAEWTGTSDRAGFTPESFRAISQISGGVPRVINVVCDRALEHAFASRLHTIDAETIRAVAAALGMTVPAAAAEPAVGRVAAAQARPADVEPEPRRTNVPGDTVSAPINGSTERTVRWLKYATIATAAVLAAAAILFTGRRALLVREAPAAPVAATTPSVSPRTTDRPPESARTVPGAAGTAGTAAPGAAAVPGQPAADNAASSSGDFEIVVASFRTDARAEAVAADVAALGVPAHRRVSESWQQVVAGPFPSRASAEDAQERIGRAGMTGTQIVPIQR
jgi:general secretion pathway protein A